MIGLCVVSAKFDNVYCISLPIFTMWKPFAVIVAIRPSQFVCDAQRNQLSLTYFLLNNVIPCSLCHVIGLCCWTLCSVLCVAVHCGIFLSDVPNVILCYLAFSSLTSFVELLHFPTARCPEQSKTQQTPRLSRVLCIMLSCTVGLRHICNRSVTRYTELGLWHTSCFILWQFVAYRNSAQ